MSQKPDYYQVLGISRTASAAELKAAYRREALKHHPDKNLHRLKEATEQFQLVGEAYAVLSDRKQRASYDNDSVAFVVIFSGVMAAELFKTVVGEDAANSLKDAAVSAAPHIQVGYSAMSSGLSQLSAAAHLGTAAAATSALDVVSDRLSKSAVARSCVGAGLAGLTAEADAEAAALAEREAQRWREVRQKRSELRDLEDAFLKNQSRRQQAYKDLQLQALLPAGLMLAAFCGAIALAMSRAVPRNAKLAPWALVLGLGLWALWQYCAAESVAARNSAKSNNEEVAITFRRAQLKASERLLEEAVQQHLEAANSAEEARLAERRERESVSFSGAWKASLHAMSVIGSSTLQASRRLTGPAKLPS